MINNKAKILAACKKYGCETIAEAVIKTKKEGVPYGRACDILKMTSGQYGHQVRKLGCRTNSKFTATSKEGVFKLFDSRVQTRRHEKISAAKKLGFTYFSEAIFELCKVEDVAVVSKKLNMQNNHIRGYLNRIEVALEKAPTIAKIKKNGVKMCTCCEKKPATGHFLCDKCFHNNSESVTIYSVMRANGVAGEML